MTDIIKMTIRPTNINKSPPSARWPKLRQQTEDYRMAWCDFKTNMMKRGNSPPQNQIFNIKAIDTENAVRKNRLRFKLKECLKQQNSNNYGD